MTCQTGPGRARAVALPGALIVGLMLTGCGGGGDSRSEPQAAASSSRAVAAALPVAQPANSEGRLLASNCFQCHGTLGNGGFEQIRGKSAEELLEYQRKDAGRNIMAAHVQGYTPQQLRLIAAYLQQ